MKAENKFGIYLQVEETLNKRSTMRKKGKVYNVSELICRMKENKRKGEN